MSLAGASGWRIACAVPRGRGVPRCRTEGGSCPTCPQIPRDAARRVHWRPPARGDRRVVQWDGGFLAEPGGGPSPAPPAGGEPSAPPDGRVLPPEERRHG